MFSHIQLFATPWTAARQASLSITSSRSLLKLISIKSVMPSNHLILCHPLLLLPSISPSIKVFPNESALYIRWPKYWSFTFSISPSNEYSGLISFRMDWLDFLAVQGTLKSLLQHHRSEPSILWCSAFFIVQSSHNANFVFTLQHCVGSSGSFASPHHQFVDICKLISLDFDWDCIESIDQVGKNWHFDNLELPYSSTWNVSPLSSLISFISFVVFLI